MVAALYMSIADVFVGASGVLITLVVLASHQQTPLVPRHVDITLHCAPIGEGWGVAENRTGAPERFEDWLSAQTPDRLLLRIGILVERGELPCYKSLTASARTQNIALSNRENTGVSTGLVFLPDHHEGPEE